MTVSLTVPGPTGGAATVQIGVGLHGPHVAGSAQWVDRMGVSSSNGVDLDSNVTDSPTRTWSGATRMTVGAATATPVPTGVATAPIVSKQAQARSLTRLGPIHPSIGRGACASCRFGG